MNIAIQPIFRQKKGNVYQFDLMACDEQLKSSIVGYYVLNCKTRKIMYSIIDFTIFNNANYNVEDHVRALKKEITEEIVPKLEKVFSDE